MSTISTDQSGRSADDEADGRLLRRRQLVVHARRGVEQHRQVERQLVGREERDVLLDAVLVDREVVSRQAADELLLPVDDHDVQRDEVDRRP